MLHYLLSFDCDNTVSIVSRSSIKTLETDENGKEIAVVTKGTKSYIGTVFESGTTAYLSNYIIENNTTYSGAEKAARRESRTFLSFFYYYF